MEHGQRAIEVVDLMSAVAESLKADRPAGALICAALARGTAADAAVWIAIRDGEQPEIIGSYPEPTPAPSLAKTIVASALPVGAGQPIRAALGRSGEVLYLAPAELPGTSAPSARRVLALAKRKHFSDADLALAVAVLPAMRVMLAQVIATSERKRRESARLIAARRLGLTDRELEVLQLLAQGLLATSIASRLALSPRTVHKHLGNIYEKMGVHDRLVAVSTARRIGLVDADL